ncbi:division plane positioning ATPase MipZ [Sphingosinicella microcystinivorans]|uniref:division plane positioning ATPase MipZ n=1 Tax=Sphingosinicella microcystinivorans TaxID=335406 RepID=UPI0022F3D03B|nr:division plane positioning ATPase MipZ [Sphingosinicella microcystinivorans]WBX83895.1 division plane positioning ATPase MipZ [Sphingosinicella microcystinivorans]
MAKAHVIVLGNEKGGTGKSTTAVHIAVALMHSGRKVAAIDLDLRQRTFTRYMENRQSFSDGHGLGLKTPRLQVIDDNDSHGETLLRTTLDAWSPVVDVIVVDTPGRDSSLSRVALGRADTLITPMNDSFVDFDLIGQVDPDTFKVKRPSFYAELIWDARKARAKTDGGSVDWVVVRNRMSSLAAKNMIRVGGALDELSKRIGFRIAPGLSERVIYRELFPRGLTLLDIGVIDDVNMSHIAARNELRELVSSLSIPETEEAQSLAS